MCSSPQAWEGPSRPRALELLERSIAYSRASLRQVTAADLDRATPCVGWTLGDLLRHLDDSLAALDEAARDRSVALSRPAGHVGGIELVDRINHRAQGLLGHWLRSHGDRVALGSHQLPQEVLAAVGALEITLHGWDVSCAVGRPRPVPPALARELWPVALTHIAATDRPGRFAAPRPVGRSAGPADVLLAQAGRSPLS